MSYTNQQYIEGLIVDDSKVISAMYSHFFPKVERLIVKAGGSVKDAQDAFQEVLLDMVLRHQAPNIQTSLSGYLLKACKNQWLKNLKKKETSSLTNDFVTEPTTNENAESTWIRNELNALIKEKIHLLSPICQTLLKLSTMGSLSFVQIAKLVHLNNDNTARQRTFACRNQLRTLLLTDPRFKDFID